MVDGCVKRGIIGENVVVKIWFLVMKKFEFVSVVFDSNIFLFYEVFDLIRYYCLLFFFLRGFFSIKRIGGLKYC